MSTISPASEPVQTHVPAWKKLGLKLKFAKEEPEDTQSRPNGIVDHKKRKEPTGEESVAEETPVERPAKKVKKSKLRSEENGEEVNVNGTYQERQAKSKPRKDSERPGSSFKESAKELNGHNKSSNEATNGKRPFKTDEKLKVRTGISTTSNHRKLDISKEQKNSPPASSKTTPASKGKSVTFTPDTKTSDGDSIKGIYKTWIEKQIATDPSFDPSTLSPALKSTVPSVVASSGSPSPLTSASTSTSDPSTKKPKKKTKTRLPKTSSGTGPSRFDPVLTYLTTHQTSPQTWKFSKPHQNQILKHLFSLSHIPSSYDSPLLPYIRGLKGASARSRLRKEALAVREEDEKWSASEPPESEKMENETTAQCIARRRRDYEAAVARMKQALREKEDEREEREWELLEGKEAEERFQKRKRAELILWSVGEEDQAVESPPPPTPPPPQATSVWDSGPVPAPPRVGRGVGMGMGGVEAIDAGGIARGSQGKKVVFSDDGTSQTQVGGGANGAVDGIRNGIKIPPPPSPSLPRRRFESSNGFVNGHEPPPMKKLRKRKRKFKHRSGVPDDDDSSSSDSSDGNSD